ncbi:MAG: hypothetical protein WCP68_12225 [Enhydrobacter sp.]
MSRRDIFGLDRNQRADVFCAGGTLRLIADHPLNAPLIGMCSKAAFVRATELTVEQGDKTVVVYAARAGREQRVASAVIQRQPNGAMLLTDWQVEEGFSHRREPVDGVSVHRIVAAPATSGAASAGKAPAKAPARPAPTAAAKSSPGKSRRDQASRRL